MKHILFCKAMVGLLTKHFRPYTNFKFICTFRRSSIHTQLHLAHNFPPALLTSHLTVGYKFQLNMYMKNYISVQCTKAGIERLRSIIILQTHMRPRLAFPKDFSISVLKPKCVHFPSSPRVLHFNPHNRNTTDYISNNALWLQIRNGTSIMIVSG